MEDPAFEGTAPDEELALDIEDFDTDGALEEAADGVMRSSRGAFLRGALLGSAGVVAALGAVPRAHAAARAQTKGDISILNFDLVLEYLQAGLYTEAERLGALSSKTLGWSRVVGAHERAHAEAIRRLLGRAAVKSPSFDFRGVTEDEPRFIKTAVAFEDLTAAVLKWQAPRLDSRAIVAAVATLHSVEARHAAWIRHVIGVPPVTGAFDRAQPQAKMERLIASTGFIASRPRTAGRGRPRLTG